KQSPPILIIGDINPPFIPSTDGATTTQVPSKEHTPIPQQTEEPGNNEIGVPEAHVMGGTPRFWIAPCISLALVILFLLALWIRYQEMRMVKLQCGFLRSLVQSSSVEDTVQPPMVTESLVSVQSLVVVRIPPLLEGE
ncbi:unnamed protein product, partial [Ranitomeya imitator]